MNLRTFIVNSFAEDFGQGNPAGVVLYSGELPETAMQGIAFDINKSETAFVRPVKDSPDYEIRWFSPMKEVPLCGHATLAASKVLHETTTLRAITFRYRGGQISVMHRPDDNFVMDFPLDDLRPLEVKEEFRTFFPGMRIEECLRGEKTGKVILRIGEEINIESVHPVFAAMRRYSGIGDRGIAITQRATAYDFVSRYFNPWYGVDEDPVTGSVHTVLARYWGEHLRTHTLRAHQASHRPGDLELQIEGEIVRIAGKAKIVLQGIIELP